MSVRYPFPSLATILNKSSVRWHGQDVSETRAVSETENTALFAMLKPGKDPKRMVKALSVRVGLSVTLFLILMASYYFGLIQGRL